ncbi:MAG TPA: ribonuclease P protein component [Candidatus Bathyarchaeia archaeon]|nr:ribonuclease P protein component [Candidatus Bathyarchaeia archaeon]
MLPKKHRLPLRTDLVEIKKKGKLFQGELFSLLVAKTDKSKPARFSFIISTKIHKRAVKRNQARRLLIEAIRSFLPQVKPGFDALFLAKKKLVGKKLKEVSLEVENLFKKTGIV